MHFVEQKHGDVLVLSIKGRLVETSETDKLYAKVKTIIENQVKKIVIDLQHVSWIASVGIGVLLRCYTAISNAGGELRLTGLSEKVQNLFSITKLNGIIQIYKSVAEAIKSYENKQS
jgi:anti-sigma B factor antagonist